MDEPAWRRAMREHRDRGSPRSSSSSMGPAVFSFRRSTSKRWACGAVHACGWRMDGSSWCRPARARMRLVTEAVVMEAVSKHFSSGGQRFCALCRVDLAVAEGELVAVCGRSGSGKTTLLSMAGGLDRPDEGRVHAAGEEVSNLSDAALERFRRDKVGWVFQASGLHPLLTAAENVSLALRIQGRTAAEAQKAAAVALAEVGLASRARHRARELSGGEQQRVALARAMVKRPRLLLADEPTGQLDTATARQVLALVRAAADAGLTVLIASHDEALTETADRVLQIQDGTLVG